MRQATTAQVDLKNIAGAYASSFGALPDNTTYFDPVNKKSMLDDLNKALSKGIEQKALTSTTGGAGTAGYALVPVYVDPAIVDRSRKYAPWTTLIRRTTNYGLTADYNVITSKDAAITAAEGATLSVQDFTPDRESVSMKYLYIKGKITGQAQATIPPYMLMGMISNGDGTGNTTFTDQNAQNAKQLDILIKARAMKEKEEDLIWNGDSSTTATEYDGIIKQQGTTNQVDKGAAAMTWDDIELAAQYAFDDSGRPNLAGCGSAVLKDIRKIMIDKFTWRPQDISQEVGYGVRAPVVLETLVGPIPVVPSQFLTNTSGSKQLFLLDTEYIEMRVLQDMTYKQLPDEDDSEVYLLKMYEALVARAPSFNAFIDNIA